MECRGGVDSHVCALVQDALSPLTFHWFDNDKRVAGGLARVVPTSELRDGDLLTAVVPANSPLFKYRGKAPMRATSAPTAPPSDPSTPPQRSVPKRHAAPSFSMVTDGISDPVAAGSCVLESLQKRRSALRGAGNGLFTTQALASGVVVGIYTGDLVPDDEPVADGRMSYRFTASQSTCTVAYSYSYSILVPV